MLLGHHLEPASGQTFGASVTEFAAVTQLSVGDDPVLMGPMQVSIGGCTAPSPFNAMPGTCYGCGQVSPAAGELLRAPMPVLRIGNQGHCAGVAISNVWPHPPIPVMCELKICRSGQRATGGAPPPAAVPQVAHGTVGAGEAATNGQSEFKLKVSWLDAPANGLRVLARPTKGEAAQGVRNLILDEKGCVTFRMPNRECVVQLIDVLPEQIHEQSAATVSEDRLPCLNYTVKKGDTLWSIGQRFGTSWEKIWNHEKNGKLKSDRHSDPKRLQENDALVIPQLQRATLKLNAKTENHVRLVPLLPHIDSHCHVVAASQYEPVLGGSDQQELAAYDEVVLVYKDGVAVRWPAPVTVDVRRTGTDPGEQPTWDRTDVDVQSVVRLSISSSNRTPPQPAIYESETEWTVSKPGSDGVASGVAIFLANGSLTQVPLPTCLRRNGQLPICLRDGQELRFQENLPRLVQRHHFGFAAWINTPAGFRGAVSMVAVGKFLVHNVLESEATNAWYLLRGLAGNSTTDRLNDRAKAIVPLVLDLSQTPIRKSLHAWVLDVIAGSHVEAEVRDDSQDYPRREYIWFKQDVNRIVTVVERIAHKGRGEVLPFAPFDARNPEAMKIVKDCVPQRGFVGIKMYTRCGWLPTENAKLFGDPRGAIVDRQAKELLEFAIKSDLPITNHHSPGGWPPTSEEVGPACFWSSLNFGFPRLNKPNPQASFEDAARWLVEAFCVATARYCEYVQTLASPYIWISTLNENTRLRLNLAHFGTAGAAWCRYQSRQSASIEVSESTSTYLRYNPVIVSGERFAGSQFKAAVLLRLTRASVSELEWYLTDDEFGWARSQLQRLTQGDPTVPLLWELKEPEHLNQVLQLPHWQDWLSQWKNRFPLDWCSKILDLMTNFPNVFADLSYFVGDLEREDGDVLRRLLSEIAKHKTWQHRVLAGTDWPLIEKDGVGVSESWLAFRQAVDEAAILAKVSADSLWQKLTCENPLRFLNLKTRMDALEKFYNEPLGQDREGGDPVFWWPAVRLYYDRAKDNPGH